MEPSFRSDFEIAVAKGNIPGHRLFTKFSGNPSILAVEEDIWDAGGTLQYLAAAETMDILSTSANDTAGGTGARVITIIGLDDDFIEIGEDVIMNGNVTPVETANAYRRVYRMTVKPPAGSGQGADGTITATASSAGTTQGQIINGNNQSLMSHFTVPAGHGAIFTYALGSTGEGKEMRFKGRVGSAEDPSSVSRVFRTITAVNGSFDIDEVGLLTEKMDFKATGVSDASGTRADFIYRMVLVENKYLGAGVIKPDPFKIA